MKRQQVLVTVLVILAFLGVICLAVLRSPDESAGQITPDPPTTPQPTVPCTPIDGCGRGPGTQTDVAFAWIDRFCNGDAVPTPPGFTTFSVNYGLGGQAPSSVQFFGVATLNGVEVPTAPLSLLQPGEKDTRVRAVEAPNGAVFEIVITGTVTATGAPVIFGNGTDVRVRSAAGACPDAPPVVTTVPVGTGVPPVGVPPDAEIPAGR